MATTASISLQPPTRTRFGSALRTLATRRAALTANNPRQIAVPLLTPILFAVVIAPALASRIGKQEEYIGATPVVAILPWFFGGALFPIAALPGALTAFAKVLPLTHVLALLRYGLVDPHGTGLHDIWGMSNTTTEAWLSLGVVAGFALVLTAVAIRVFSRSAVR